MNDDEWFDEACELAMIGGIGTVTTIMERPKKGRKKYYRRPIGFITNIDELIPCDDE